MPQQLIDTAAAIIGNESRRVETLAQNLANLATPAYKQQLPFQSSLRAAERAPMPALPIAPAAYPDLRGGALVTDGDGLHAAIAGEGWFEVDTGAGLAYTRHGAFRIDARGRLVTAHGHAVQMEGGGDIDLRGRAVRIAADGSLLEDGRSIGRLRVVDITDRAQIQRAGDGLLRVPRAAVVDVAEPTLQVGALEASNVSTADNMVRLMEAVRRAELGQKLAHAYDDMLGRALRQASE